MQRASKSYSPARKKSKRSKRRNDLSIGENTSRDVIKVSPKNHANEKTVSRTLTGNKPLKRKAQKVDRFENNLELDRYELETAARGSKKVKSHDARIVSNAASDRLNKKIKSQAFTWQDKVYVGKEFSRLHEFEQLFLLGHEFEHVEQNKEMDNSHVVQRGRWDWVPGASAISEAADWVGDRVSDGIEAASDLAEGAADLAAAAAERLKQEVIDATLTPVREKEEYRLLSGAIGKDPISGEVVEVAPQEYVRTAFGYVDGGEEYFDALNESGIFPTFFTWFKERFTEMGITWAYITSLVAAIMNLDFMALGVAGSIRAAVSILSEPVVKIFEFLKDVGLKVVELIFNTFMMTPLGQRIKTFFDKAARVYDVLFRHPVEFMKNILAAVKLGFDKFLSNIVQHLISGVLDWLLGAIATDGPPLQMPLGLHSIAVYILGVLGISYERFMELLKEEMIERDIQAGEERQVAEERAEEKMEIIETSIEIVQAFKENGIQGVWDYIKDKLMEMFSEMKEAFFSAVQSFLITTIIQKAIEKLAPLLIPATAILSAIKTGIDALLALIEQIDKAIDIITGIFDTIIEIADGAIERAANFIERVIANFIPMAVALLAGILGLGGIPRKVADIVGTVVEQAQIGLRKLAKFTMKIAGPIVDAAWAAVQRVKEVVEEGVERIRNFVGSIFSKERFNLGSERHSLEIVETQSGADMIMRSEPVNFISFMDDLIEKVSKAPDEVVAPSQKSEIESGLLGFKSKAERIISAMVQENRRIKERIARRTGINAEDVILADNPSALETLSKTAQKKLLELIGEMKAWPHHDLLNNEALGTNLNQLETDLYAETYMPTIRELERTLGNVSPESRVELAKDIPARDGKPAVAGIDFNSYEAFVQLIKVDETLEDFIERSGKTKTQEQWAENKRSRSRIKIARLIQELSDHGHGDAGSDNIEGNLYPVEGIVDTYSANQSTNRRFNARYRNIGVEADHSPQGSLLTFVGELYIKRGDEQVKKVSQSSSSSLKRRGYTLNLALHRHRLTRSYQSRANAIVSDFHQGLTTASRNEFGDDFIKTEFSPNQNSYIVLKPVKRMDSETIDQAETEKKLKSDKAWAKGTLNSMLAIERDKDQETIKSIIERRWNWTNEHKQKAKAGSDEIKGKLVNI